jgi:hypothetical protein
MILSKDTFTLYAASHYDNPMCISEDEFLDDLKQLKTVRRMMTRYINGEESNLRLLINNIIIFYNCFEHHSATNMIAFQMEGEHIKYFNAVLKFLSLPMLIPPECVDDAFYDLLQLEFQ